MQKTDDSAKFKFAPITARVMAIWNGGNLDPSADTSEDQEIAIILDRTNFYAEMGGQVGDRGTLALSSPSPGTPGEGGGEGLRSQLTTHNSQVTKNEKKDPHPDPSTSRSPRTMEYRAGDKARSSMSKPPARLVDTSCTSVASAMEVSTSAMKSQQRLRHRVTRPCKTTPPPTLPTGPCEKPSAKACSRKVRWSTPKSFASISHITNRSAMKRSPKSRRWSPTRSRKNFR